MTTLVNPITQLAALITSYFSSTRVTGISANPSVIRRDQEAATAKTNGVIIVERVLYSFPNASIKFTDHRYVLEITIDLSVAPSGIHEFVVELVNAINANNDAAGRTEEWIITGDIPVNFLSGYIECELVMQRLAESVTYT